MQRYEERAGGVEQSCNSHCAAMTCDEGKETSCAVMLADMAEVMRHPIYPEGEAEGEGAQGGMRQMDAPPPIQMPRHTLRTL